jgi:GNAT superfamily N-acetyltransferase
MLKIRRIYDDVLPINREALKQVQQILRTRFSQVPAEEIDRIGEKLRNPFKQRFRSILLVAENLRRRVQGFALLLHEPVIGFCYLDWIATARGATGGGLGSALYDSVRAEAVALKVRGLFFECLPDDPRACPDPAVIKQNRARLRFYERYGARPILGTGYEMPVKPGDTCMPHLVFDGLDLGMPLRPRLARRVVRAILERKYADYCPLRYVAKVVATFRDNPIRLRPYRYVKPETARTAVVSRSLEQIALVVNAEHEIHSGHGSVAILDIDYHHGNGQQDIFHRRSDVLTVLLHGHPSFACPYFAGFEGERGEGEGFNLNIPLPEKLDGAGYHKALTKALGRVRQFNPQFLVVALGLDTAKGDPTGTWQLRARDFETNGRLIGDLGLPTLVVQEGGYRVLTLGLNGNSFFKGLAAAGFRAADNHAAPVEQLHGVGWRFQVQPEDPERVGRLVDLTGFFHPEEVQVGVELVQERLAKGEASGYHFVMAGQYGRLMGYTCYGPIACTRDSFDFYWIAVHPESQRKGLGRRLIRESEARIRKAGGGRIYVDTSQRDQYASTRVFYGGCGYRLEAVLKDFYAPEDGKVIYCKVLSK